MKRGHARYLAQCISSEFYIFKKFQGILSLKCYLKGNNNEKKTSYSGCRPCTQPLTLCSDIMLWLYEV